MKKIQKIETFTNHIFKKKCKSTKSICKKLNIESKMPAISQNTLKIVSLCTSTVSKINE
jgi:hypothetical protein